MFHRSRTAPTGGRRHRPLTAAVTAALLATTALLATAGPVHADSATRTVTFTGDYAGAFANPDRGFHNRYEIIDDPAVNDYATDNSIAGFSPDMLDRTFARARADGDTLIHSYVHLDKYQSSALPQELLDNLGSGLAAVRAAGEKIVLRFAYTWDSYPDVTEARIEAHIAQLAPVLTANADVIDHFEAGFLGMWGEWHDSAYTDPFNATQAEARYRIIKTELDAFPATVPIAVRYPIFGYEFAQRTTPPPDCDLADNCLLTQAEKDRLGFHDDCFLSDSADMGTYDQNSWLGWFDVDTKKQWVYDMATSTGGNQIVGGETCDSAGDDDPAGANAQYELSHQHWTEINEDYAPVNIDIWKAANLPAAGDDPAETLFHRAQRKLGYRLRLVDTTTSTSAEPGKAFTFSAHLANDGYAAPIQQRPVYLVLDNGTHRYDIPMPGVDVRTWRTGDITVPAQTLTLPADMAAGSYTLALWLPDQYTSLHSNPAYDIRLADVGTWNASTGYNVLATGVTVGTCSGDCTAPSAPVLSSPGHTATSVSLSWTPSTDNVGVTGYDVHRGGTTIATVPGTGYTDTGLSPGSYSYTVTAHDAAGNTSLPSDPVGVTVECGDCTPPPPAGLVLDDFDGTPGYPSAALNDLGRWTGGNCFLSGGGAGTETGGALVLQYDNCGWFGSDVTTDLSARTYLVVRIKGAAGGEQSQFNLSLGGVTKVLGDYSLDGGGHPAVSTGYQDIRIPMAANGISRTAPGQLTMGFWYGGAGTVTIDSITFQ